MKSSNQMISLKFLTVKKESFANEQNFSLILFFPECESGKMPFGFHYMFQVTEKENTSACKYTVLRSIRARDYVMHASHQRSIHICPLKSTMQ